MNRREEAAIIAGVNKGIDNIISTVQFMGAKTTYGWHVEKEGFTQTILQACQKELDVLKASVRIVEG
jgi:hypothetical protein